MPRGADVRRLSAAETTPSSVTHDEAIPFARELCSLRNLMGAIDNNADECEPEFSDAMAFLRLSVDSVAQVYVARQQREMEIRDLEARMPALSIQAACGETRDERQGARQELFRIEKRIHELRTRPIAPTNGHEEIRRDLFQRLGYKNSTTEEMASA